jgi:hypothetical protein
MIDREMAERTAHYGTQASDRVLANAMRDAGIGRAPIAERSPDAPAGGIQTALAFAGDGSIAIVGEPASVRRRHHRGIRDDARRTAEYLASRGATPAESLHNVARMKWRVAIAEITKATGCTKLEAFRLWVSINENLLPYTASRINSMDLAEQAAAGSMAMAHFLAASAISDRLGTSHESLHRGSIDTSQAVDIASENETLPSEVTRSGLPPKGTD